MKKDKEWAQRKVDKYLSYEGVVEARNALIFAKGVIEQLDEQQKPVIPKFVADWIESQDDPIYEMCVNYEMWGVNGDDGTTRFTGEIAEWFDDTLNVENYYRACIDGYEVEKEPLYYVRENNYLLCKYKGEVMDYVEVVERNIADLVKLKLTEKEIKDYDERYWAFAEEVKE